MLNVLFLGKVIQFANPKSYTLPFIIFFVPKLFFHQTANKCSLNTNLYRENCLFPVDSFFMKKDPCYKICI